MSHSCVENYLHVIFATKDRNALITIDIEKRLYSYMAGIARKRQVPFLNINGAEDHVHILLKLHPLIALSSMMKELKSYSTGWCKKEYCNQFSWQEGYGAFSCSKSHLEPLTRYIDNQKEHHRCNTFAHEVDCLNRQWGTFWMKD